LSSGEGDGHSDGVAGGGGHDVVGDGLLVLLRFTEGGGW
jgi:hypothetical protein